MITTARRERWIKRIHQALPYEHRRNPTRSEIRAFYEQHRRQACRHAKWCATLVACLVVIGLPELALGWSGFLLGFVVVAAYCSKVPDEAIEEYVRRGLEKRSASC